MSRAWEEDDLPPDVIATLSVVKDVAFRIHRQLGAGFKESVYQECMAHALAREGMAFVQHPPLTVTFEDLTIFNAGQPDFIVNGVLVVELKASQAKHPLHAAQLINYLKASGKSAGVLINFNVILLKHGFDRYVHPDLLRRVE